MVDEGLVEGHIIPLPQMSFFCYPQWTSLPDAEKEQSPNGTAPGSPRRATNACSLLSPQTGSPRGKTPEKTMVSKHADKHARNSNQNLVFPAMSS